MGNVTVTVRNDTNGTNYSIPTVKRSKPEYIPPRRGPQTYKAVETQVALLFFIAAAAVLINIIMMILLQRKLRSLPYVMLQNIVAADMLGPVFSTPMLFIGLVLDQFGIAVSSLCNIQGFIHSAFCAVYLNSISMIFLSRFLAVFKPDLYHKIFVNKIIIRLLSLMIWTVSIAVCAPPMNGNSTWGYYDKLDITCWLAWRVKDDISSSYNSLVTIVTLGLALVSFGLAAMVVFAANKVSPAIVQVPPPYPSEGEKSDVTCPAEKAAPLTVRVNTEVFYIAMATFILYLLLWVPLTVMDGYFLQDWRDVDYRAIITFIYLFLSRSLFHPIIFFVFSDEIRKEFLNLYIRCKCSKPSQNGNSIDL